MKLLKILSDLGNTSSTCSKVVTYLDRLAPNEFLYPVRFATKVQITDKEAAVIINKMVLENLLIHVSVPMHKDTRVTFEENAIYKIVEEFEEDFHVFDENQNEINSNDLIPIAAFQKYIEE